MTNQENKSALNTFYDWAEKELGRPINKTPISDGGMWVPNLPALSQRGSEEYAKLHLHWLTIIKDVKAIK
jgi:hypothetical protein